jgi:hypothetical protein
MLPMNRGASPPAWLLAVSLVFIVGAGAIAGMRGAGAELFQSHPSESELR